MTIETTVPSEAQLRARWAKHDEDVTNIYIRQAANEEEQPLVEEAKAQFAEMWSEQEQPFRHQFLADRRALIARGVSPLEAHRQAAERNDAIAHRPDFYRIQRLVWTGTSVDRAVTKLDRVCDFDDAIDAAEKVVESAQEQVDALRQKREEIMDEIYLASRPLQPTVRPA